MDAPKEASRVLPFLWQGSLENATDQVFSKDAKITHIVNVSTFTYDLPSTVHPQNYLQIAVLDAFGAHLAPYLDKCVKFLKSANRLYEDTNGETGSCLVHCQAGISRSSIVSIAFLMNHRHMGWEPAKDYLKQRRYFINPNMNFAGELVTYEKLLIERGVINKNNGADVVSISGFSFGHSRKSSTVSNFEGKSKQKTVDHNGYIKQQNEKHKKPSNSKKPSRPKFLKLLCVNTEKNDPTDNMVENIAKSEKKLRNHELGKIKSDAESVSSNAPTSAPRSKPNRPSGLSINCLGKVRRPKPSSLNIKRNQNSSYNNFQQITDEVLSSTPVNDKDSVGKNSLGKNSLGRNSDKVSISGESSKDSFGGSGLCGMKAGAKVAMKNVRKSLKLPIVRHQDSSNSEKFPSPNECDVHSGRLHSTGKTVESSGSSKSSKRNSNFGLNLSRLKPTRTSPKPSSPKPAGSPKPVESQKGVQNDKSSQNSHKNSWLPVSLQKPSDSPVLMENSKVRNSQVRNSKTSQVRASPKFESKNTKISSENVARASQSVSRSSSFHCKNHSPISMSEHSSSAATFVNNCCDELESPNKFATTNPFRDLVSSNTAESSLHDSGNQSIQNQGCAKIDTISTQSCAISDTRVKSNTPSDIYSKSLPRPKKSENKNAYNSPNILNSKNTQNCQNNQNHNNQNQNNQNQNNQHQNNKNHQLPAQNTCPQRAANQVPASSHNFDQTNYSGNSFLEKQPSVTSANSSGIVSGTNSGNTTTLPSHSMSTDEQHTSAMSDMNSSHVCTSPTSSSTLSSPSSNIKNSSNNSSISFIRKAYDPVRHFTSELKNTATNTLLKLKTSRDYDETERGEEGLAIMGGGLDGSFDASSAGRYHQIGYDSEEAKSPERPVRGTPLDQKLKKITIKPPATACENERQELAEIFAKTSTAKIVNPQQLPTPPPRLHEQQRIKSSEQYNPPT